MKFDIFNITTGKEELGVYADTPQLLKMLYSINDEDIEIVKAYNENPINNLGATVVNEKPAIISNIPTESTTATPPIIKDVSKNESSSTIVVKSVDDSNINERFFTDNGIEYKINNIGSFKKTWVDVDTKLFRLINIDNNKEIKLNNKKIQTLDWVKIG